ncbi:MAG: hypothetical protein KC502_21470, partial [Myxococcales bacterium]|nr:hypothetical protein [Myxococcales bacterium]
MPETSPPLALRFREGQRTALYLSLTTLLPLMLIGCAGEDPAPSDGALDAGVATTDATGKGAGDGGPVDSGPADAGTTAPDTESAGADTAQDAAAKDVTKATIASVGLAMTYGGEFSEEFSGIASWPSGAMIAAGYTQGYGAVGED